MTMAFPAEIPSRSSASVPQRFQLWHFLCGRDTGDRRDGGDASQRKISQRDAPTWDRIAEIEKRVARVHLHVFRSSVRRGRPASRIYDQDELCARREPVEHLCLHVSEGVARRNDLRKAIRRAGPVPLGPANCLGPSGGDGRSVGRADGCLDSESAESPSLVGTSGVAQSVGGLPEGAAQSSVRREVTGVSARAHAMSPFVSCLG